MPLRLDFSHSILLPNGFLFCDKPRFTLIDYSYYKLCTIVYRWPSVSRSSRYISYMLKTTRWLKFKGPLLTHNGYLRCENVFLVQNISLLHWHMIFCRRSVGKGEDNKILVCTVSLFSNIDHQVRHPAQFYQLTASLNNTFRRQDNRPT